MNTEFAHYFANLPYFLTVKVFVLKLLELKISEFFVNSSSSRSNYYTSAAMDIRNNTFLLSGSPEELYVHCVVTVVIKKYFS